jgi:hypothetical protein
VSKETELHLRLDEINEMKEELQRVSALRASLEEIVSTYRVKTLDTGLEVAVS